MKVGTRWWLGLILVGFGTLAACSGDGDSSSGDDPVTGTPVVFRLDDIQATYCAEILDDILAPFLDSGTPITLGIIGRGLLDDEGQIDRLAGLARDHGDTVHFANHSFTHPARGLPSLGGAQAQTDDIEEAQDVVKKVTGIDAETFIPPGNTYDQDTLDAIDQSGLKGFSAECTWSSAGASLDCPPSSRSHYPDKMDPGGLPAMPAGVVIDAFQHFSAPGSVQTAQTWANSQIEGQGFAVFMLHPQELSTDPSTCKIADTEKLDVLRQVIAEAPDHGWQFTNFHELGDLG